MKSLKIAPLIYSFTTPTNFQTATIKCCSKYATQINKTAESLAAVVNLDVEADNLEVDNFVVMSDPFKYAKPPVLLY